MTSPEPITEPLRTHTTYHTDFHGLLLEAARSCRVVRLTPSMLFGEGIEFSAEIIDPSDKLRRRHIFEIIGKHHVYFLRAALPEKPVPAPTDAEWSDAVERFISAVAPCPGKTDQYMDTRNELMALIRQARRTAT